MANISLQRAGAATVRFSETKRLLLFSAIVLLVPAIVSHSVHVRRKFDTRPVERLRARDPALVFIGDSMLGSRIDQDVLERALGGKRAEVLWKGGAASACWYLTLKNYVGAARVHPERVIIFFRDRMLTNASFRTDGIFRPYLESLMRNDEPVLHQVLGKDFQPRLSAGERLATALYPLNAARSFEHEKIARFMFRVVARTRARAKALERRVNGAFDVVKMRGELVAEAGDVSEQAAVPFDADPAHNFLPHIVEFAAKNNLPLLFVHVKRHPDATGHVAQSQPLQRYVGDLRRFLENRGCAFLDMADDPAITPDMYLKEKDDHIGPWAKERSTQMFAEKLRALPPP